MYALKVLSCWYEVYLNGEKLPQNIKEQIDSLSITDSASGCSTARIVLNDFDFVFIEDDIFVEDVPIKIEGGWNECLHRFDFEGYVAAIDIDFGEEGYPVLTLNLMDATYLMSLEEKNRTWENVTSRDVVTEIAAEYGFGVEVYPENYEFILEECVSQSNASDISFIRQLADRESDLFAVYLKDDRQTLYYGLRGVLSDPVMDLWYKQETREIQSFRPQINRSTTRERVVAADIDPRFKRGDSFIADTHTSARETQGNPVVTSSSPTGRIRKRPSDWGTGEGGVFG